VKTNIKPILTDKQKDLLLDQETFEKFGYWAKDLSYGAIRKVIHRCDVCGERKETKYRYFVKNIYTAHPKCQSVKYKHSCLEKYGVDNPQKTPEIRNRVRETNLVRYGVECPLRAETIQRKTKQSVWEKYGVESTNQSQEVKEKKKRTFLERYGVPHVPQYKETHEKIRQVHLQSWLESCGVSDFGKDIYQAALQYVQEELQKEGYKLLSTSYKNSTTKIDIECPLGHQYPATWDCWRWRNTRCPLCQEGKNERRLGEIVREIYPDQKVIPQDNLGFLGRQRVDFSVREWKIAFEYDGEQHFKPVRFNSMSLKKAKKLLLHVQQLDKHKNESCKKFGYVLIRVRYDEDLTLENIKSKIEQKVRNDHSNNG